MRQLLDLDRAAARYGGRRVYVVFGATSSAISLMLVAALASLSHQPLLLPSLGSTAFLIFNRPRADAAAPRAIVVGHLAAVLAGETALFLSGLGSKGASLEGSAANARLRSPSPWFSRRQPCWSCRHHIRRRLRRRSSWAWG